MNTFTTDEILADMYCAQVQTAVNIGDSTFNTDIHPELSGDDYADAILAELQLD